MTEPQPEQEWLTATATEEDMTVLFRLLPEIPQDITPADFPARIEIIWNYQSPNETGMPGPEDLELMNQFEQKLVDAWQETALGFMTMLITGNQMCEWQWYLKDADQALVALNEAATELPPLPIDIHTETDPDWYAYSNFMRQVTE
ncbi:DUF695 domain-containing protein [Gimesia fumaroli]|uniref:DUF695 domain-containing protein n=1 Tax=Gimesia fumaroli TaxID=2527976 RepID=A0A518IEP5_9PLAN|nr:DUF695 domain-containing protein [Gimesia fumaroli]QDV51538.1 hypothetical protein Enr17x_35940 [Gimesia fumaroli]